MPRNEGPDRHRDRDRRDVDRRNEYDKRSKRRARSRSYSRSPIGRGSRDHKRRRDASPNAAHEEQEAARRKALAAYDDKDHRTTEKEKEPKALDEEIEKRRKRIEAWQEQRRKLHEKEQQWVDASAITATAPSQHQQPDQKHTTEAAEESERAVAKNSGGGEEETKPLAVSNGHAKAWNLEDDDDDDDDEHGITHTIDGDANNAAAGEMDGIAGQEFERDQPSLNVPVPTAANASLDATTLSAPRSFPKLGELKSPFEPTNRMDTFNDDDDGPLDKLLKKDSNSKGVDNSNAEKLIAPPPPSPTITTAPQEKVEVNDAKEEEEEEIDPLDAFMAEQVLPEIQQTRLPMARGVPLQNPINSKSITATSTSAAANATDVTESKQDTIRQRIKNRRRRRNTNLPPGFASDSSSDERDRSDDEDLDQLNGASEDDDEAWAKKVQAGRLTKGDKLGIADHSSIQYPPFRRNFYIEVPELARMSQAEVDAYRKQLDGIRARGNDVPKPIKTWNQAGLSARIIDVLKRSGFDAPLPIQAQAIPVIMNGRDCMGIAKTGSGKTLAFVLPMMRHIKDQPAIASGDGPIALVMAPTRELVTQIGKEIKRFSRSVGLTCTCVYGGSGVAQQISELKRGTEIVVCTPGRMIDILVTGAGKITNLRRITYLVMDEADRMFDMGFEPQIMRIVNNIRPDRQTVLFSATFPRSVEVLARQVLTNPVEIQVGGRSVVNPDITQYVEIREPEERFLRLLELLGEWYERGKLLVFVASQDKCDSLFRDLLKAGYPCLSLHGGKDQSDRESTISDFKSNVCNVLVATSVAARGLDVKDLVLVVNYDCPNHHEDYVHRVGRTGRAGNKGTAVTFISPEEDQFAPDLVKALKESGAPVPADLAALAESFDKKKKAGTAKTHGSGFGGSGFKFDEAEEKKVKEMKKKAAKEFGIIEESESEEEDDIKEVLATEGADGGGQESATADEAPAIDITTLSEEAQARIKAAQALAEKLTAAPLASAPAAATPQPFVASNPVLAAAQAAAQRLSIQLGGGSAGAPGAGGGPAQATAGSTGLLAAQPQQVKHFQSELEINDFPQQVRWKVTHRQTVSDIAERLGAIIVVKGRYVKPGTMVPEGERKLYLSIEGTSTDVVRKAKAELKRLVEESTEKAMRREAPAVGRFSII